MARENKQNLEFTTTIRDKSSDGYPTSKPNDEEFKSVLLNNEEDLSERNGGGQNNAGPPEQKTFETVFHAIGHNGRFQIFLLVLFVLTNSNVGLQNVNTVFTLTTPKHRCKLPGVEHDSYAVTTDHQAQLVDRYIPKVKDGGYRKCHVISTANNTAVSTPEVDSNLTECSDWVFDKTVMKRTLVSELDLVCDKTVIRSHINMVLFSGKLAAAFLQGHVIDAFGRRPSLIVSCIGMLATAVGSAFVFDPISLLVARFMAGFFATFVYLSAYVLGIEFLTINQRTLLSIFSRVILGACDLYLSLMAYLLRDWQHLLLSIVWPAVLALALCWFVPESPRWLLSKNKVEKAEREVQKRGRSAQNAGESSVASCSDAWYTAQEIVDPQNSSSDRIARMNRKSVPHGIIHQLKTPDEKKKPTVLQLFKDKRLAIRWIILYINWVVICMTNYGLIFYISNMRGNIFVNYAIGGILDAAVSVCSSFVVNKFSRKYFYLSCSMFASCACILTFVPIVLDAPNWCVIALSLVGKAVVVAAFTLLYTYSAELFPTTHRGVGVASCSMMARVGGLLAAYIADLSFFVSGKMASVVPQLVLGTCAMLGCLLALFLPETRGRDLPETLDDIRGKHQADVELKTSNDERAAVA